MKNTYRHFINGTKSNSGFYHEFKSFKVYWAYRGFITESLTETNFVQRALKNGFKELVNLRSGFRPNENWFGVSKMHPDAYIVKDEKEIYMSLQGSFANSVMHPCNVNYTREVFKLAEGGGVKYIRFVEKGKTIYESFFGELPSNDFLENFIL